MITARLLVWSHWIDTVTLWVILAVDQGAEEVVPLTSVILVMN